MHRRKRGFIMCQIKTGADITNMSDVQNLITGCILSEEQPYTLSMILDTVKNACNGNKIGIENKQISEMVRETINVLLRSNYLSLYSGLYFSRPSSNF